MFHTYYRHADVLYQQAKGDFAIETAADPQSRHFKDWADLARQRDWRVFETASGATASLPNRGIERSFPGPATAWCFIFESLCLIKWGKTMLVTPEFAETIPHCGLEQIFSPNAVRRSRLEIREIERKHYQIAHISRIYYNSLYVEDDGEPTDDFQSRIRAGNGPARFGSLMDATQYAVDLVGKYQAAEVLGDDQAKEAVMAELFHRCDIQ